MVSKGYFLADEVTDRGQALASQDLKFARRLIPFQESYVRGMTKLVIVLCAWLKVPQEGLDVKVTLKRPNQMMEGNLESYTGIADAASGMIRSWKDSLPENEDDKPSVQPSNEMFTDLIRRFGMPEDIIDIFENANPNDKDDPASEPIAAKSTDDILVESMGHFYGETYNLRQSIANNPDIEVIFESFNSFTTVSDSTLTEARSQLSPMEQVLSSGNVEFSSDLYTENSDEVETSETATAKGSRR